MSKFKQVGKALLGAVVATSVAICCFAGPALASEVQPRTTIAQEYVFAFGWYGHTGFTHTAPKHDATPTYVRAEVMDMAGVHLYVDGYYVNRGWVNQTCYEYAYLSQSTWANSGDKKFWIHTTVFEEAGYQQCDSRFRAMGSEAGNMSGEWSPDSWGTYPSLNTPYV